LKIFFPGYENLDHRGLVKVGRWIDPNQILALRVRPVLSRVLTSYERLLFDVLEQKPANIQNVSFSSPEGNKGRILNVESFFLTNLQNSEYYQKENVQKIFKESFPFKSLRTHIFHFWQNQYKEYFTNKSKYINNIIVFTDMVPFGLSFLFKKINTTSFTTDQNIRPFKNHFAYFYFSNTNKNMKIGEIKDSWSFNMYLNRVRFTVRIYRNIQRGDKLAGRHGNKGILARLINYSEIPYLPNGIPFHLVLNPLGIPSRINVGQIYETLLGLAGFFSR
jgi:DNA-directed RNA polymerase subunit beta